MATPGLGSGQSTGTDPQAQYKYQLAVALARIKGGASWFDWIAILSVVNSVITLAGGGWHFILGLGITEIADAFAAKSGGNGGRMAGLFITLLAAGFFWLMGRFTKQGQKWALVMGLAFYVLDTLITLLIQDWFSAAFHGYALFRLSQTFSAITLFEQTKERAAASGVFAGPPMA